MVSTTEPAGVCIFCVRSRGVPGSRTRKAPGLQTNSFHSSPGEWAARAVTGRITPSRRAVRVMSGEKRPRGRARGLEGGKVGARTEGARRRGSRGLLPQDFEQAHEVVIGLEAEDDLPAVLA